MASSTACERRIWPLNQPNISFSAPPEQRVLDYRNGWYHTSTGKETIRSIGELYMRDPDLVARLNTSELADVPSRGAKIYVPPLNNTADLRDILMRINRDPGLVPRDPPPLHALAPVPREREPERREVVSIDIPPVGGDARQSLDEDIEIAPASDAETDDPKNESPPEREAEEPKSEDDAPAESQADEPPKRDDLPEVPDEIVKPLNEEAEEPAPVEDPKEETIVVAKAEPTPKATPTPTPVRVASSKVSTPRRTSRSGFAWPLAGEIVRSWSTKRRYPFRGVSIAAAEGSPIRAARSGRVIYAGELKGYGKIVIVDHGDQYASVYGYNDRISVKREDDVAAGQTIATIGRPTKNARPQLFFQIRKDSRPVDPTDYLPKG